jgi:hypothetical protein
LPLTVSLPAPSVKKPLLTAAPLSVGITVTVPPASAVEVLAFVTVPVISPPATMVAPAAFTLPPAPGIVTAVAVASVAPPSNAGARLSAAVPS